MLLFADAIWKKIFCKLYVFYNFLYHKNSERSNGPVFDSRWALDYTPRFPWGSSSVYSSVVERSIAAMFFFVVFIAFADA